MKAGTMQEPDTTWTDFALAALCAVFVVALLRAGGPALLYALLFAALGAAALLGGLWHGWVSGRRAGDGLWLAVMLAVGLANAALWLIAGRVLGHPGPAGLFPALAWGQLALFAAIALLGTRGFGLTSAFSLPPVLVLIVAHGLDGGPGHRFALAGFSLALVAAGLQAGKVALPRLRLGHNALYHLVQAVALTLVFLSAPT